MSHATWAPEADTDRIPPARAEACRPVAGLLGYVHACPKCAAALQPGAVIGYMTAEGLRRHLEDDHGGAP